MNKGLDRGASAVEYGLMLAAIAALVIGAAFGIGQQISGMFEQTSACLNAGDAAAIPCRG
ncbi:Flp family type IVb pilin [Kineosporia sp. A_224]|uniref:Flp family type IVb pilin n=1 Tax=Kineosporia sp. A_224 TaxID=1962180 RepID=UPI000B4BD335|nr:Flp family type IVb pilin [Kineosporia sp. A_224]